MAEVLTKFQPFGGTPGFFRAACQIATRGGNESYKTAGYELTRHLAGLSPYDASDEEWQEELDALERLVHPTDDEAEGLHRILFHLVDDAAVFAWFEQWYPRCAALVPTKRRESFLAGVYECFENGDACQ